MVRKKRDLTPKEHRAQKLFIAKLGMKKRTTNRPVIIAMIGLVGSGKSSAARELAKRIGATVIKSDDIRVELRKLGEPYERVRVIAENATLEIVKQGGNVILDSDFIDPTKRASLREKVRGVSAELVFVCTYADFDVMIGHVITATYKDRAGEFFSRSKSKWVGSEQSKAAAVKIREMLRRLPFHYRWQSKVGGEWVIKNPPCAVLANIDTTNQDSWKKEVLRCAKGILTL